MPKKSGKVRNYVCIRSNTGKLRKILDLKEIYSVRHATGSSIGVNLVFYTQQLRHAFL